MGECGYVVHDLRNRFAIPKNHPLLNRVRSLRPGIPVTRRTARMRKCDYSSAGVVASEIGDYSTLVVSLVRKAGFDSQTKA